MLVAEWVEQSKKKTLKPVSLRALEKKTYMNESKRKSTSRRKKQKNKFLVTLEFALSYLKRPYYILGYFKYKLCLRFFFSLWRKINNKSKWVNCWLGLQTISVITFFFTGTVWDPKWLRPCPHVINSFIFLQLSFRFATAEWTLTTLFMKIAK